MYCYNLDSKKTKNLTLTENIFINQILVEKKKVMIFTNSTKPFEDHKILLNNQEN